MSEVRQNEIMVGLITDDGMPKIGQPVGSNMNSWGVRILSNKGRYNQTDNFHSSSGMDRYQ